MAGSRIKGITIEIAGDVTPLQKSLSGLDKSLRTTQSNLRDVNKLLKLDPANTELLTQKQKLLKQAIADTKDRLRQLKDAQKDVKQGTDDWDALQREIIATEQNLKGLEGQYKDFGSVAKQQLKVVSEKTKEIGGKIKNVGAGITKGVTVPIVGIGAAAAAAFTAVDEGEDIIVQKTGATGEALDGMREILENITTSIPTDFATAGAAIGEVNTRFGVTGDKLQKLSEQFIKFAELNGTDVSTSIDIVQKALSAYGLTADDAEGYLDRLNITSQETGISVDKLAEGIVTNGAAFQQMGLSIDEATAFMGQLAKSGANSETVLNGMRKALKTATAQGKPLNKALYELQQTIKYGTSEVDGLTAAYDLFGKSGDQIYSAVQNGTIDFMTLAGAVSEAGGSVTNTFDATLDPMDRFKTTLNEVKIVGAELGTTIFEVLTPVLSKLNEVVGIAREKWASLTPEQQAMIVKIAMIAAAVGPLITILGTLVTAIGALLSPIGAVIAIIGGAVAAGIALYKNWDKIKQKAGELKDKVSKKWDEFKERLSTATQTLRDNVSASWRDITTTVTNLANSAKTNATNAWSNLKTSVSGTMSNLKTTVSEKWSAIKTGVSEKVSAIYTNVSNKFGSIVESVRTKFGNAKTLALNIFDSIRSGISEKISAARDFVSNAIEAIKNFFHFEWSLPHLKMPHFSITGSFSLNPPSVPHLSVEWYKKAYDTPYLFTTPTIVNGRGFGDGGGSGEIVYGRDQLMRDIAAATGDEITVNVYAAEGMNVNELADKVIQKINFTTQQRARVYA